MGRTGPTRDQFVADPRSMELRAVSLALLAAFEALLCETGQQDEVRVRIEHLNGRLIELGVTASMNEGLAKSAYKDPVTAAEYLAGQLVVEAGRAVPTGSQVVRDVQEWSEAEDRSVDLLSTEHMSQPVREVTVRQGLIELIRQMFAYEAREGGE